MESNHASRIFAAAVALCVGMCVPASGAAVALGTQGALTFFYNPGAAPPRWGTLSGKPHAAQRAAICFYGLRRLRPIGYLSASEAVAGIAPFNNDFLIASTPAVPGARSGDLTGRFTTITQYDPLNGRSIRHRKYNWLMRGIQANGRQTTFHTAPDGVVWLTRYRLRSGKITVWLSSLDWATGRILGSTRYRGNSSIPFVFAVDGAALLVFERGRSAEATVVRTNGARLPCLFPKGFRGVPYYMAPRGRRLDGMSMTGGYFISIDIGGARAVARERKLAGIQGRPVRGYATLNSATGVVLLRSFGGNTCELIFVSAPTGTVLRRVKVGFPGTKIAVFGGRVFLVSPGGRVARCTLRGNIQRVGPPPFGPLGLIRPSTPPAATRPGGSTQKGG